MLRATVWTLRENVWTLRATVWTLRATAWEAHQLLHVARPEGGVVANRHPCQPQLRPRCLGGVNGQLEAVAPEHLQVVQRRDLLQSGGG
eukprot:2986526-Pyramimonas_sp.AAC.1